MSYILYINGNLIELSENSPIAQTKQVNDISSLENRQSNYTNRFAIPLTANNVRAMDKLYFVGNQSKIPYSKNEANLFDAETGICLIYKGWANISGSSDKGYEIYVYDGTLEIYKAIENKMCSELDLTAITHDKTVPNVIASFADTLPYKYIMADFNGKSLYDINKINIDYLVPSIRTSWLVQQIESYTGFNLSGSFKTNPDYLNLWITYPKGTPANLELTDIYTSARLVRTGTLELKVNDTDFTTGDLTLGVDDKTFTATESSSITIELIVDFRSKARQEVKRRGYSDYFFVWVKSEYFIVIDGAEQRIGDNGTNGDLTTINYSFNIEEGSSFYVKMKPLLSSGSSGSYISGSGNQTLQSFSGGFQKIDIQKYLSINFDFVDEFRKLPMKTILNEILWHFGLTMAKEKYTRNYNLKTLNEIIDISNAIDWTSKFSYLEGEKYAFESYKQLNYLRYKYNDAEANHHDGAIAIENENLEESKTILNSTIYAPERVLSNSLGFTTNTYKLWNKEVKDDGSVDYKVLSDRFYFMRSLDKTFDSALTIGSDFTNVEDDALTIPIESYKRMPFKDIVQNNYSMMAKLLNDAKIITANFYLKNKDVSDVDFMRPYYIEQLGGCFLLNKISNFIPGKLTKCELIKINFNQTTRVPDYSEFYSNDYSH